MGAVVALAVSSSVAHELPETFGVALRDGAVEGVVTSRGIVPSASGDLTCRQWFGLAAVERPTLLPLSDGAWLFATSRGAFRGTTDGCRWQPEPTLEGTVLTGVQPVVLQSLGLVGVGVGSGVLDGVVGIDAEGRGTLLVPSGDDEFVASVFATSDASAYVLWVRISSETGRPAYRLTQWQLDVASSAEIADLGEVPFGEDDVRVLLAGVAADGTPLLEVTRYEVTGLPAVLIGDDGAGWTERWSSTPPLFAVLAPDATLWLGSEAGLFRTDGGSVELVSDAFPIASLRWSGDAVYAGSRYPLGPMVAVWRPEASAWQRLSEFTDVTPTSTCEVPEDLAEVCGDEWADWEVDVVPIAVAPTDGGVVTDAGLGADAGAATAGSADGCAASAASGAPPRGLWALLLGLLLAGRARYASGRIAA